MKNTNDRDDWFTNRNHKFSKWNNHAWQQQSSDWIHKKHCICSGINEWRRKDQEEEEISKRELLHEGSRYHIMSKVWNLCWCEKRVQI